MEEFKRGDKVYLTKDITEEDWDKAELFSVDYNWIKANKYVTISDISMQGDDEDIVTLLLEEDEGNICYPANCFSKYTSIQLEVNKLINIITGNNAIRLLDKKEKQIFLNICYKLNISIGGYQTIHWNNSSILYAKYNFSDKAIFLELVVSTDTPVYTLTGLQEPFRNIKL